MANINTAVILKALLVSIVLEEILRTVGIPLFSDSLSVEAMRALRQDMSFLLYEVAVVFSTSVLGGYICGKHGNLAPYMNTVAFASVNIFMGLIAAFVDSLGFDLTIVLATVLAIVVASFLGAQLALIRNAD